MSYRCQVGGSSSLGAMTEKALLPRDVQTYMGWTEPMNQMIL